MRLRRRSPPPRSGPPAPVTAGWPASCAERLREGLAAGHRGADQRHGRRRSRRRRARSPPGSGSRRPGSARCRSRGRRSPPPRRSRVASAAHLVLQRAHLGAQAVELGAVDVDLLHRLLAELPARRGAAGELLLEGGELGRLALQRRRRAGPAAGASSAAVQLRHGLLQRRDLGRRACVCAASTAAPIRVSTSLPEGRSAKRALDAAEPLVEPAPGAPPISASAAACPGVSQLATGCMPDGQQRRELAARPRCRAPRRRAGARAPVSTRAASDQPASSS